MKVNCITIKVSITHTIMQLQCLHIRTIMLSLPEAGMSLPNGLIRKEQGMGGTWFWSGLVGGVCETMATKARKCSTGDGHYWCILEYISELLSPVQGEEQMQFVTQ